MVSTWSYCEFIIPDELTNVRWIPQEWALISDDVLDAPVNVDEDCTSNVALACKICLRDKVILDQGIEEHDRVILRYQRLFFG